MPVTKEGGLSRVKIGETAHPQFGPMALLAVYWLMPAIGAAFFIQETWGPPQGRTLNLEEVQQMEKQQCETKPKKRKRRRK